VFFFFVFFIGIRRHDDVAVITFFPRPTLIGRGGVDDRGQTIRAVNGESKFSCRVISSQGLAYLTQAGKRGLANLGCEAKWILLRDGKESSSHERRGGVYDSIPKLVCHRHVFIRDLATWVGAEEYSRTCLPECHRFVVAVCSWQYSFFAVYVCSPDG